MSAPATVTVTYVVTAETVTAAAVDGGSVNEDGSTTISVVSAVGVGSDDHVSSYAADLTSVAGATITNNGDGTFKYDPSTITGVEDKPVGSYTDTFTYTATDGHGDVSAPATVTVTYVVTAETVTAAAVDGGSVNEDGSTTISVVSAVGVGSDDHVSSYAADLTSVAGATITNNGDGTFKYDPSTITGVEDKPVGSYTDTFTYTATDGHGDVSAPATVTVTYVVTAETVTAAAVDGGSVNEDGSTTISVVSAVGVGSDDHVSSYAADLTSVAGATITNNGDGTFKYDPSTITGVEDKPVGSYTDTFTYTATDGHGDVSAPATVTVTYVVTAETVTAAAVDGGSVNEDGSTTISVVSAVGVGSDDHVSSYAADLTSVAGATITNNGDGTFKYDPSTITGVEDKPVGSYTDTFTYTATDGHGDVSAPATVTVTYVVTAETVTAAAVDGGSVNEDGSTTISVVSAVGVGSDDHVSSYAADLTSVAGATITNNGDGTFKYDPSTITGVEDKPVGSYTDTFTYTATDGHGDVSAPATVTVTYVVTAETVTAANDPGSATEEGGTNNNTGGSNATGNVLTNDTHGSDDPITVTAVPHRGDGRLRHGGHLGLRAGGRAWHADAQCQRQLHLRGQRQ